MPALAGRRTGLFVVELDGAMIGIVELGRPDRDVERRSPTRPEAGEWGAAQWKGVRSPA